MSRQWFFYLVLIILAICGSVLYLLMGSNVQNRRVRHIEEFKDQLESLGIELIKGKVDSPSVIISLNEKDDFLKKISELDAKVVYYEKFSLSQGLNFWVFEENMLVAYKFFYSGWD